MPTIQLPNKFLCRPYQQSAWEAIFEHDKKRIVCAWHRGAGKDLFGINALICLMMKRVGVYIHGFPKYSQAKRAIWKGVHDTDEGEPMGYLDHFPPELVESMNGSEMSVKLINGSQYHLMGFDGRNAEVARGMNPVGIILSEYSFMMKEAWDTVEPRLSQNNGVAMFLSTPNGRNHFYNLLEYAKVAHKDKENPLRNDYFCSHITVDDTKVFGEGFIESKRSEGMSEDWIQQEYYCSFNRGAEGSYYGKQIQCARDDERITRLSINRDVPCYTGWDIGIGDSTSIWIFQQLSNGKINFLDYYENHGEKLEHYINYLDKYRTANNILWGSHYVPHDMRIREFTSGISRLDIAEKLGYKMTPVLKNNQAYGLDEGIQCVRSTLPNCVFDEKGCKHGLICLDMYHKKYNEVLKVYSDNPEHDRHSHGADAFRMACVGIRELGDQRKLSPDTIRDMRQKYLGY